MVESRLANRMIVTSAIPLLEPLVRRVALVEGLTWYQYLERVVREAQELSNYDPLVLREAQRWYVGELLKEQPQVRRGVGLPPH